MMIMALGWMGDGEKRGERRREMRREKRREEEIK
jgi:hypothetical protein